MDGFRIGRVRGIDLRLNWSVVIIAVLITWSLAESVFPNNVDGVHTETEYWVVGAITAVGFLAALRNRRIYHALTLIHAEPALDWSLDSLGRERHWSFLFGRW